MTGGQKRRKSEDIDRARVSRMEKSAEGSMPGTGERERESGREDWKLSGISNRRGGRTIRPVIGQIR